MTTSYVRPSDSWFFGIADITRRPLPPTALAWAVGVAYSLVTLQAFRVSQSKLSIAFALLSLLNPWAAVASTLVGMAICLVPLALISPTTFSLTRDAHVAAVRAGVPFAVGSFLLMPKFVILAYSFYVLNEMFVFVSRRILVGGTKGWANAAASYVRMVTQYIIGFLTFLYVVLALPAMPLFGVANSTKGEHSVKVVSLISPDKVLDVKKGALIPADHFDTSSMQPCNSAFEPFLALKFFGSQAPGLDCE